MMFIIGICTCNESPAFLAQADALSHCSGAGVHTHGLQGTACQGFPGQVSFLHLVKLARHSTVTFREHFQMLCKVRNIEKFEAMLSPTVKQELQGIARLVDFKDNNGRWACKVHNSKPLCHNCLFPIPLHIPFQMTHPIEETKPELELTMFLSFLTISNVNLLCARSCHQKWWNEDRKMNQAWF